MEHGGFEIALDALWFPAVLGLLVVLFGVGLRLPRGRDGATRWIARLGAVAATGAAVVLAGMALHRHDAHLDLTAEKAFTPSPETVAALRGLDREVDLVYFYQKQSPGGRAAKTMVE
ncbi:MAG: hypothetical protein FJX47_13275, partial [Alphaproteobacteria bacterium]|nr:hypothetical protein [Alphaproteobacteria bacterium]